MMIKQQCIGVVLVYFLDMCTILQK